MNPPTPPPPQSNDDSLRPAPHLHDLVWVETEHGVQVGVVCGQPGAHRLLRVVAALDEAGRDLGWRRSESQVVDVARDRVQPPPHDAGHQGVIGYLGAR